MHIDGASLCLDRFFPLRFTLLRVLLQAIGRKGESKETIIISPFSFSSFISMEEVREALEETREEFEEFQEGSRALEAELEAQLKQGEDNAKELRTRCNTLKLDNDILRVSSVSFPSLVCVSPRTGFHQTWGKLSLNNDREITFENAEALG